MLVIFTGYFRALATFVVHITEQICRNLYVCVFNNNTTGEFSRVLSSSLSAVQAISASFLEHPKSPMHFVDYRFMPPNSKNSSEDMSPVDSPRVTIKYPANYMLNVSFFYYFLIFLSFLVDRIANVHIAFLHAGQQSLLLGFTSNGGQKHSNRVYAICRYPDQRSSDDNITKSAFHVEHT